MMWERRSPYAKICSISCSFLLLLLLYVMLLYVMNIFSHKTVHQILNVYVKQFITSRSVYVAAMLNFYFNKNFIIPAKKFILFFFLFKLSKDLLFNLFLHILRAYARRSLRVEVVNIPR